MQKKIIWEAGTFDPKKKQTVYVLECNHIKIENEFPRYHLVTLDCLRCDTVNDSDSANIHK